MSTLAAPHAEPRRTGEKVRAYSQLAGKFESSIWRRFDPDDTRRNMQALERYERETRPPGKREGAIGHIGREVYLYLMRRVDYATGRLEPSIEKIAEDIGRSRAAVVRALARLREHGFVGWIRRYVPTGLVGFGVQVKQTSNAYWIMLPAKARRLLGPVIGRRAPESSDLAHEAAERAAQWKRNEQNDTRLAGAIDRLGEERHRAETRRAAEALRALMQQREFTEQPQSPVLNLLEGGEVEKDDTRAASGWRPTT